MAEEINSTENILEYYCIRLFARVLSIMHTRAGVYIFNSIFIYFSYLVIRANVTTFISINEINRYQLFCFSIWIVSSEFFYRKNYIDLKNDREQFIQDIKEANENIMRIKKSNKQNQ